MASSSKFRKTSAVVWALGLLVVAMLFMGAIAGPKFIRFQQRAMESEAKATLRGLLAAQQAYFDQHGAFTSEVSELQWQPAKGNRYSYFLGESSLVPSDPTKFRGAPPKLFSRTKCSVTSGRDRAGRPVRLGITEEGIVLAAVRTDGSGVHDCWSIASMDRVGADGIAIPFGVPFHESEP